MDRKPSAVITGFIKYSAFSLCVGAWLIACTNSSQENVNKSSFARPDILKWVKPDADVTEILTSEPAECLNLSVSNTLNRSIVFGRAAFRSPYLLGGQATRQGMSCNACHINGQNNVNFFIEGLSSGSGTADVTNFHFSTVLGDGIFNPKPIPSLINSPKPKTAEAILAQEKFILRLVEKEFDGAPPSQAAKTGLIAYVRALNRDSCAQNSYSGKALLDFRIAILSEELSILVEPSNMDERDIDFLKLAIRAELGLLYTRFPVSAEIREKLTQFSRALKPDLEVDRRKLITDWSALSGLMEQEYQHSLFSKSFIQIWYGD